MQAPNRSGGRNVHIFNVNDPATVLGGFVLTDGVTNSMVDVVCIFDSQYFLQDKSGTTIQRDDHTLHRRKYYIATSGTYKVQPGRDCLPLGPNQTNMASVPAVPAPVAS